MATSAASKKSATKKSASAKTTRAKASQSKSTKAKTSRTSSKTTNRKQSTAKATPVMRRAKGISWIAILEALVIGVLGIFLITNATDVIKLIFYVVGIFLVVKGIYKIVNYFAIHGKYDFFNNDLLYGVIALVFGVLAIVLWEQLGKLIGIVVGAWMIYGALVRMNSAIKMHTAGIKEWFYVLLLAMIMMAIGIYMVVSVGAVPTVVGWMMVAAAIISIVDDVIFIKHIEAVEQ